jgi:hypothetical protein
MERKHVKHDNGRSLDSKGQLAMRGLQQTYQRLIPNNLDPKWRDNHGRPVPNRNLYRVPGMRAKGTRGAGVSSRD